MFGFGMNSKNKVNVGIDLGTSNTKLHNGTSFKSGISEKVYSFARNVMCIQGKKYVMELPNEGENLRADINKNKNSNMKLNFYYALTKLAEEDELWVSNAMVGLPCSQWENDETAAEYKKMLSNDSTVTINVDGVVTKIIVDNVDVVPEGSTAYFALPYNLFNGEEVLILDIGSLTMNEILYRNNDIVKVHTTEYGILKFYEMLANVISSKEKSTYKSNQMLETIEKGLPDIGKRKPMDDLIKEVALQFLEPIYNHLKVFWNIKGIIHVYMIGGGSIILHKYLKEFEDTSHLQLANDPLTIAAKGMGVLVGGDVSELSTPA